VKVIYETTIIWISANFHWWSINAKPKQILNEVRCISVRYAYFVYESVHQRWY